MNGETYQTDVHIETLTLKWHSVPSHYHPSAAELGTLKVGPGIIHEFKEMHQL